MSEGNSYRQILRSSSIMGGAQAINYVVSLVRVKIVALLLGPSGVGLVGLYASAISMVGTVSGLGINCSGVRAVTESFSAGDAAQAARTVCILRRACWVTGLLGWGIAVTVARPISEWMLGSPTHAWAIALLGCTLLIGAVSGGQMALLQGLRRIGDMARANVWGALINTTLAIALYTWLGQKGIVPVMIATAAVGLGLSYWFTRRLKIAHVPVSWQETLYGAKTLLKLGVAFMWSGLLTAGLDLVTRSIISRELGMDAAGIYQAAWALSGMFAAFILQAMGADFYPRLTAIIKDKPLAVQVVNEQTETGVLLALPGLLATLAFAPLFITIFYSREFSPAAAVLSWMVVGVFGRVVSWPMGFIQLAKGASRWFMASETTFIALQAGLMVWLIPIYGVIGAAYAFALAYIAYTFGMLWIGKMLIDFRWSPDVRKLLFVTTTLMVLALVSNLFVPDPWAWLSGTVICVAGSTVSLRGLMQRLGPDSRLVRWTLRIPGARWVVST